MNILISRIPTLTSTVIRSKYHTAVAYYYGRRLNILQPLSDYWQARRPATGTRGFTMAETENPTEKISKR